MLQAEASPRQDFLTVFITTIGSHHADSRKRGWTAKQILPAQNSKKCCCSDLPSEGPCLYHFQAKKSRVFWSSLLNNLLLLILQPCSFSRNYIVRKFITIVVIISFSLGTDSAIINVIAVSSPSLMTLVPSVLYKALFRCELPRAVM